MSITVRVISHIAFEDNLAIGFFGNKRRYKDEVFEIEHRSQLGRWMEEIDPKTGKKIDTKSKPKKAKKPSFNRQGADKLNAA